MTALSNVSVLVNFLCGRIFGRFALAARAIEVQHVSSSVPTRHMFVCGLKHRKQKMEPRGLLDLQ